jgi:hypothetical protein
MKKLFLLVIFLFSVSVFAQDVWDFETTAQDTGWTVFTPAADTFSVVANPDISGLNTTAHVAKFTITNGTGVNPWEGVFNTHVTPFVVTAQNDHPTLLVYKDTTSRVDFKIEGAGWNSGDTFDSNTVAHQWVQVSYDFSKWIGKTVTTITVIPDFASGASRTYSSVSYFDLITFTPANVPVELTSFMALTISNNVVLHWSTATETNNAGFDVERSNNNVDFAKIGFIKGHGTSTMVTQYSFTDENVSGSLYYRLKQVDFNGNFKYSKVVEVNSINPLTFALSQNYPNPFNPTTVISYSVPQASFVSLKVYNILGKEVASLVSNQVEAGIHKVNFNASNLNSGMYFYTIKAGNFTATRKLMLLK